MLSIKLVGESFSSGRTTSRCLVCSSFTGPFARYADLNNLPVKVWPLPKESPLEGSWDVGVVASFGHLIPQRIIKLFHLGILNVHASLLPRWRGAAPIIHALMNGDKETGVTIMRIKPFHFDVGDVVAQEKVTIDPQITAADLTQQLSHFGANLLMRSVSDLPSCLDRSLPQPSEGTTLAPKITARSFVIDWSTQTALEIYNRWRAVQHMSKLQTTLNGVQMKLEAILPPVPTPDHLPLDEQVDQTGRVLVDRKKNLILVRCSCSRWLPVSRVAPAGKTAMTAVEFANGYIRSGKHVFRESNECMVIYRYVIYTVLYRLLSR
nr:EOG090X0BM2 [Sida crystallina]